jgi:hypothetical protein
MQHARRFAIHSCREREIGFSDADSECIRQIVFSCRAEWLQLHRAYQDCFAQMPREQGEPKGHTNPQAADEAVGLYIAAKFLTGQIHAETRTTIVSVTRST